MLDTKAERNRRQIQTKSVIKYKRYFDLKYKGKRIRIYDFVKIISNDPIKSEHDKIQY